MRNLIAGLPWRRHGATAPAHPDEARADMVVSETRWPMASVVVAIIILTVILPAPVRPGPPWLLPGFEAALLLALVAADPGKIDRRSSLLRVLSVALVSILGLASLLATGLLIDQLVKGGSITNEAGPLLSAGLRVCLGNGLAFALLYWELDGGGPAARALAMPAYPDFAFPPQLNPSIMPPNWRPRFVDYIYLSFTNSVAFSPTDVMPLVPWAKMAMGLQALTSFAVIGLVIARAVNVFS